MEVISEKPVYISTKAYFQSKTHINLQTIDVKVILAAVIREIIMQIVFSRVTVVGGILKT